MNKPQQVVGISGLVERFRNLERSVANYRERHERLEAAMKADPEYDPLSCLPGLMDVQEGLTQALAECRMPHILKTALDRTPKDDQDDQDTEHPCICKMEGHTKIVNPACKAKHVYGWHRYPDGSMGLEEPGLIGINDLD